MKHTGWVVRPPRADFPGGLSIASRRAPLQPRPMTGGRNSVLSKAGSAAPPDLGGWNRIGRLRLRGYRGCCEQESPDILSVLLVVENPASTAWGRMAHRCGPAALVADFANLFNTGAHFDTVTGSNGLIGLNKAVAVINGGGDAIVMDGSSSNYANLYNTAGKYDTVTGSNGRIGLNNAVAAISGGNELITLDGNSADYANLYNTGANYDTVIGSNGKIGLNSAVAAIAGGGDTITMDGSASDYANLFNTGANYDSVLGSNGKIGLTAPLRRSMAAATRSRWTAPPRTTPTSSTPARTTTPSLARTARSG